MAVEEDSGGARVDEALPDDGGMRALHLQQFDVVHARGAEEVGDGMRTAADVGGIEAISADGGDADERLEFRADGGEEVVDRGAQVVVAWVHRSASSGGLRQRGLFSRGV